MSVPCFICDVTPKRLHSDHCHRHNVRRGRICPRCNSLMRYLDSGKTPQVPAQQLQKLIEHAARCPDCVAGKPAVARIHQLHVVLDDELGESLKAYAAGYGIPVAAAARIILHKRLKEEMS